MPTSRPWADYVEPDRGPDPDALARYVFGLAPDPVEQFHREDPHGNEIDRPGAAWLTLTSDPLAEFRPRRDYRRDPIRGEPYQHLRPFYSIAHDGSCDRTSHDEIGGEILIGDHRGSSTLGGSASNRLPTAPSEGQRLRRNRLGTGSKDEGAIRQYEADDSGLSGGTDAPAAVATEAPPGSHLWTVTLPSGRAVTVAGKNRTAAKRAAKALLGIESADPLPAGTRIRCLG